MEFGPFENLVADGGAIVASVTALTLSWKGRSNWEPSEQDIPNSAQRVGGLVSVAGLTLLWSEFHGTPDSDALRSWLITFALVTVVSLSFYAFIASQYTYEKVVATSPTTSEIIKVIGGFRLTARAKAELASDSHQNVFKGLAYDEGRMWTRASRSLAKVAFILLYVSLVGAGTLTLAAAAIAVS